ncbi:MAG: glycosyltransferase family 4 protein [Steroidobacteraceae bacterium]
MRIAYWTTACLAPEIEAISKEVFDLAAQFRDSRVFAVSPHLSVTISRGTRAVGFHPRFGPLLRAVFPLIERAAAVNHIYAEVAPWLFFKALRRRPIVLTVASEKGDPVPEFLSRCRIIAAQTEAMASRLIAWGVERRRVRLIYPGVDLTRFTAREHWSPARRTSVLFATFPRSSQELPGRGVLLLLETARRYAEIDFSIVTRPWGAGDTAQAAVQEQIRALGLTNVRLLQGTQHRMDELYRRHDFTVIPYTVADGGKECPRSLIEALACGVPVLISEIAPLAAFVGVHDCGRVICPTPQGLAAAVEQGLLAHRELSSNAARAARAHFDLRSTLREYGSIYDELA